jgi:PAS domain S-box-containing protein
VDRPKVKILLVEDNAIIALSESEILKRYGFDVIITGSGEEAVHIAKADNQIDLVLLDIDLGDGIDGTEAAEQILQSRDIPVMFLSSHTEQMVLEKTEKITSYGYASKGSGETALITSIKMALKLFNAHQSMKERDETLRINEARLQSLVNILQHHADSVQEFLDFALNESIKLTRSKIGYIYFYNEEKREFTLNTWSKEVMKECLIADPQEVYALDKTGIWGEAVRQRIPIVLNDFQSAHPLKKGYPEGHAPLSRFLTVPVYSNNSIVAVIGVANKESDYDNIDVLQLMLLMDAVWKVVDRKRTEIALKESETRYRMIVENINDSFLIHDFEGNIQDFNINACTMYGYTREELGEKNLSQIDSPEDAVLFNTRIKELLAQGHYSFDGIHLKKDGIRLQVNITSRVISGEGKGTAQTFIRDISRYKEIESSLRDSADKFKRFFDFSPVGAALVSLDSKFIQCNRAFATFLGYEPEEIVGKTISDITYPDDRPLGMSDVPLLLSGQLEYVRADKRYVKKDGSLVWGNVSIYLQRDAEGKPVVFLPIIVDINDRKIAEDRLGDTEFLFNALLEHSPIYVFFKDHTIRAIHLSKNYENMLGMPLENILGKTMDDLFPSDLAKSMIEDDKKILFEGKMVSIDEQLGDRHYTTVKFPIIRADHPPILAGFTIDITERKKAELELSIALKEKVRLLNELQHRVKNSLALISSMINLEVQIADSDEAMELARRIRDRVQSVSNLYDILYRVGETQTIRLDHYLHEIARSLTSSYLAHSDRIVLEMNPVDIKSDVKIAAAIGLILNEIITNALKYAFPGNTRGKVEITMEDTGKKISITISDNGVGLPEKINLAESKGLGMQIITMLTKQINGSLEITGNPGTVYRLTIAKKTE